MKRVLVRKPGGHEALELVEEADPIPGPGQVRVRTRAAGINYADTVVREGFYEAAKGQYPITPGFEFAGVVDGVGAGVEGFREGDRVLGFTRFGGYSSVQIAEPERLRRMPDDWDFPHAAGLPAVQFTAFQALFKVAHVAPGETVLVHSAAGGVGTALLQQAKIAGCRAVGVVGSASKRQTALDYGAAAVVVRGPDLWEQIDAAAPEGIDVSFDANGVTTLRPAWKRLKNGGRLVVYGFAELMTKGGRPSWPRLIYNYLKVPRFSPLEMTTTNRAVMGFNVVFLAHRSDLAKEGFDSMMRWAAEGQLKKPPVTTFPVEKVADAHRAIESGKTVGKVILTF